MPQDQLREVSRLFSCLLMYIGGSPVGTAGGVKTVTVAVVLLSCGSILAGHEDTECFRRRIPMNIVRTALSVCIGGVLLVLVGSLALMVSEPEATVMQATYEVVSATATVGLTAGLLRNFIGWKYNYYCAYVYGTNRTYYNSAYDCRKH